MSELNLDERKVYEKDDLKVRVFKKSKGENQKGFLYYPYDDIKFKDCIIVYFENEKSLEEGDYPFNDFKEVSLMADIIHPDAPIPVSRANGKILLSLKTQDLADN